MTELGHHDQQSIRGRVVEANVHVEPIGHRRERRAEIIQGVGVASGEGRPEEQRAADPVVELLVLLDVQAVLDQERVTALTMPDRWGHASVSTSWWTPVSAGCGRVAVSRTAVAVIGFPSLRPTDRQIASQIH